MAQKLSAIKKQVKPAKTTVKKPTTKQTFDRFAKKHGDALTKLAK